MGSDSTSETVKQAIIKQVLIESQQANARTLMEVRTTSFFLLVTFSFFSLPFPTLPGPPPLPSHSSSKLFKDIMANKSTL